MDVVGSTGTVGFESVVDDVDVGSVGFENIVDVVVNVRTVGLTVVDVVDVGSVCFDSVVDVVDVRIVGVTVVMGVVVIGTSCVDVVGEVTVSVVVVSAVVGADGESWITTSASYVGGCSSLVRSSSTDVVLSVDVVGGVRIFNIPG